MQFPNKYHKVTWTYSNPPVTSDKVTVITREGFLRKNIVAVSFFQNCAIHQYS